VIPSKLNIKGFGPSLKSSLLAWRAAVEQRFVFNPNEGVDPADIRALDQELGQLQAGLIRSLSTGTQQLKQALMPWQVERASLITNLTDWAKRLAQTEVNTKTLGRF
jgi:DNA-binding helix-hairpin-helix protein with protein kinase domain